MWNESNVTVLLMVRKFFVTVKSSGQMTLHFSLTLKALFSIFYERQTAE